MERKSRDRFVYPSMADAIVRDQSIAHRMDINATNLQTQIVANYV